MQSDSTQPNFTEKLGLRTDLLSDDFSSLALTPFPPSSHISSPISFTPLSYTREALLGMSCKFARDFIPMGRSNDRPPAPTINTLQHFLTGPNSHKILLISSLETPMDAFKKLIDYGVQSAPVIDPSSGKICGLLDIRDLVSLVVAMEEERQEYSPSQPRSASSSTSSLSDFQPTPATSINRISPIFTSTAPTVPTVPFTCPPSPAKITRSDSSRSIGSRSLSNTNSYLRKSYNSLDDLTITPPSHPPLPPSHSQTSNLPPIHPPTSNLLIPNSTTPCSPFISSPCPSYPASPQPAALAAYLSDIFSRTNTSFINTRQLDHKPQDYTVTYLAARNRAITVDWNSPIVGVIEQLACISDVHRVVVVNGKDKDRKIVDIISQSDIVKLLHAMYAGYAQCVKDIKPSSKSCEDSLPDSASTSQCVQKLNTDDIVLDDELIPSGERMVNSPEHIKSVLSELLINVFDSNIGSSPVISVPSDSTMFSTLRLMSTHKISGAAIVNENQAFVGNTSGADLKLYLQAPVSSRLYMKVIDFVDEVRKKSVKGQSTSPNNAYNVYNNISSVIVQPTDNLIKLIERLTSTGMHRVFVIDPASQKPISVISVEDIVKMIYRGLPNRKINRQLHRAMGVQVVTPILTNNLSGLSSQMSSPLQ